MSAAFHANTGAIEASGGYDGLGFLLQVTIRREENQEGVQWLLEILTGRTEAKAPSPGYDCCYYSLQGY